MKVKENKMLVTHQSPHLQFHQIHLKLGPQTRSVKLYWTTQAHKLNHLEMDKKDKVLTEKWKYPPSCS